MRSTPASWIAPRSRALRPDVVLEVALGHLHRLARRLVRGEVHDGVDAVLLHDSLHECRVGDVADFERRVEHGFAVAVLERVEHDDVGARVPQRSDRVRADVSRAARHQNRGIHRSRHGRRGDERAKRVESLAGERTAAAGVSPAAVSEPIVRAGR